MNYVSWAVLGMAGYSFTTLFVKLATRDRQISSFAVLAVATVMVAVTAVVIAIIRGDFKNFGAKNLLEPSALWTYATGVALTVAVTSLFRALSLGPASTVVPIYGMFVVGGAVLGILFLGEPLSARKIAGIALAALSVFLIAGNSNR